MFKLVRSESTADAIPLKFALFQGSKSQDAVSGSQSWEV